MSRANSWSPSDEAKIREMYGKTKVSEIAHELNRTEKAIRSRAKLLSLKTGYRRAWSDDEDTKLREMYPHQSTPSLVSVFGRTQAMLYRRAWLLGLEKSREYLASFEAECADRLREVGASGRYPKGHVPANKGMRRPGWAPGRMAATQFKKGNRTGAAQRKWCPVGTVKPDSYGYLRVKIADEPESIAGKGATSTNWRYVHKLVWEAANGPIPPGHRIWWKDGDHKNCALENLELVSGKEHMSRTTIHNLSKPLKQVMQLKGSIRRVITMRSKANAEEQNRGPAKPPVRNTGSAQGRRQANGS